MKSQGPIFLTVWVEKNPSHLPTLGIGMEEEQVALKTYGQLFKVCKNRPENDAHWDSEVGDVADVEG